MRYPPREFRPAPVRRQSARTPLFGSLLAGFLLFEPVLPAATAADKSVPVATSGPAVPLGARQLADIAAKGVPATLPPGQSMPPVRTTLPTTVAHGPARTGALTLRRLPCISEALGPIPREEWIRRALAKPADIAVVDGRPVVVPGTGPAPARPAEVKR